MKRTISIFVILGGVVALLALLAGGILSADGHDEEMMVEVSITNLTRGQILSPVFVARHDSAAGSLYALGQPASEAMAKMAEDADATGLMADWHPESNRNVAEAMVADLNGGPVKPGETVTVNFNVDDSKNMMSFASMLVSTNDAFIGANGLDLSKSRTIYLNAYDSGTEANSEDCAYIPGPPCGKHAHDSSEPEGFVHVHAGVHGGTGSDLDPAMHDWHNPTARLGIKTWKLSK